MPAPARTCPRCGGPGPFYASQPACAWCAACFREAANTRYAMLRVAIIEGHAQQRLATLQSLPGDALTRRQRLALLRSACPPGHKVCSWCWEEKMLRHFKYCTKSQDGRDYYCRECRQTLDRIRKERKDRKAHANT